MHIKTGGVQYPCRNYVANEQAVRYTLEGAVPDDLGAEVSLCQDDGFELCRHTVADWLRWEAQGNTLVLTNLPVPIPTPEPPPPPMDELTMTQLAVAELAQTVEDNNTANQIAIAELAELMTGGTA